MSAAAFSTPAMDSESEFLLQSITSHGGYAYARMAARAAAGDQRAAETARDMAWEQLHSGPWHSVLPLWRDAYSMACLYVAKFHFCNGELTEALRALDMGIIMGGPLLRSDVDSAIEFVSAAKGIKSHNGSGPVNDDVYDSGKKLLICPDEFDWSQELKILPSRSLCGKTVVKRSALSLEGFLREYFVTGSPVVITDAMAHWPALARWKYLDYLKNIAGDRTVPVETLKCGVCFQIQDIAEDI